MNTERVIGWMRDIGQLIFSIVVEEDEETITVSSSALVGVSNLNGQINIQFIPIDIISMTPTVGVRNFVINPEQELKTKLRKDTLLFYNLEIQDQFQQNYRAVVGKPLDKPEVDNKIVKLFE